MLSNFVEAQPAPEVYVLSELNQQTFSNVEDAAWEAAHQLRTGTPTVTLDANGKGGVRQSRIERLKQEIAKVLP
jgi:hypothetical protein